MRSRKYLAVAGALALSLGVSNSALAMDDNSNDAAAKKAQNIAIQQAIAALGSAGDDSASVQPAARTVAQIPGVPGGTPTPPGGIPAPPAGLPGALPGAAAPQLGAPGAAPAGIAPAGVTQQRTIWGFLGLPPTFAAMGDSMCAKKAACKAKLEQTPLCQLLSAMADPLLALVGLKPGPPPIGSDALLNTANPAVKDSAAVQQANAIKQQEDAAPAKIQAIKYLAGFDCKCEGYKGIKAALLEALKDCNEEVRFEAAKALGSACCCDKEVVKILEEVATKQDEFGNYKEWSNRVRQAAAQSVAACSGIIPRDADDSEIRKPEVPEVPEVPPTEVPPKPQAKRGIFQRPNRESPVHETKFESPAKAQEVAPEIVNPRSSINDEAVKSPAVQPPALASTTRTPLPMLAPTAKSEQSFESATKPQAPPLASKTVLHSPAPMASATKQSFAPTATAVKQPTAPAATTVTQSAAPVLNTRDSAAWKSRHGAKDEVKVVQPLASHEPPVISSSPLRGTVKHATNEQDAFVNPHATKPAAHIDTIETKVEPDSQPEVIGSVSYVDSKSGLVRLHFAEGHEPSAGSRADVFHKYLLKLQHLGELEITGSSDGVVTARPTGELTIRQVSRGDRVIIRK